MSAINENPASNPSSQGIRKNCPPMQKNGCMFLTQERTTQRKFEFK